MNYLGASRTYYVCPDSRLDEGADILETLTSHEASWHKSCRRLYYPDRLMLRQKRIESARRFYNSVKSTQTGMHPNG